MARVLYLVHRIPYPPNKGDKVRSYHLLRHLAARHEVLLGAFIDDPEDEQHTDVLRPWCAELKLIRLDPTAARLRSLAGLATGRPLTLEYYRSPALRSWVAEQRADLAVVFSSAMAQYVDHFPGPVLVDFVDMDSAKWTEYASKHPWPKSWIYGREGRKLAAYERQVVGRVRQSFFVTDKEAAMFKAQSPGLSDRVGVVGNGVDTAFFQPDPQRQSPYPVAETPLVFTGAMDYWPNVDAVTWFAERMLPPLRSRWPGLKLYIVGRAPTAAVRALAGEAVHVTGTVADVRPWLQHAALVVAPLRLARGVQNKVLEAMAMAKAVVASASCVEAIDASDGVHLRAAADEGGFVKAVEELLSRADLASVIGLAARERVVQRYGWDARLAGLDHHLEGACA